MDDSTTETATRPDEWRDLEEGATRVLVGDLTYADKERLQLAMENGRGVEIVFRPPMMFEMDMFMNPRFMLGVRRAILVEATPGGWVADLQEVFGDVDGHGCPPSFPRLG